MAVRRHLGEWADPALAAGLGALYLTEILLGGAFEGDRAISIPFALAFSASLAWRRSAPLIALGLGLVVIEVANLLAPPLAETGAFLFGIVIAIYSVGAYSEGRSLLFAGVMIVAAIPLAAIESGESLALADLGFFVMFFGGSLAIGQVTRRRRARELTLTDRALELEAIGEEQARVAVADERSRIARELHDVVAHAVGVIVIQARGARHVIRDDPEAALAALDEIEGSGTQALEEMRRLLDVLGDRDAGPGLAPQPSLRRVEELVEGVRAAGLPVELDVDGEIADLPPGVDVSAYRIVQEGLTNALKHAGPARARVLIRRRSEALEIDVVDDGPGAPDATGAGRGLIGMRERVSVYGGRLRVGRRPEGGFALEARLPLGTRG